MTSRAALRRTSTDACSAGILKLDQAADHVLGVVLGGEAVDC
jgi:hypothetical protein